MDINQTLTTRSHLNVPYYLQESPYPQLSNSKCTPEASLFFKKGNCSLHILSIAILLAFTMVVMVTSLYICKTSTVAVSVDKGFSASKVYDNKIPTLFDCGIKDLSSKDWYYYSLYNPGYACEPFKVVSSINIQSLQVRAHECNDTDHCYDLISTYLGIMEEHSKFGFFIDNDANVYGGRGWFCEFWACQIWVAVMVEGFGAASESEKERILRHFKEGVIPHDNFCSLNVSELQFNYLNDIVI